MEQTNLFLLYLYKCPKILNPESFLRSFKIKLNLKANLSNSIIIGGYLLNMDRIITLKSQRNYGVLYYSFNLNFQCGEYFLFYFYHLISYMKV